MAPRASGGEIYPTHAAIPPGGGALKETQGRPKFP